MPPFKRDPDEPPRYCPKCREYKPAFAFAQGMTGLCRVCSAVLAEEKNFKHWNIPTEDGFLEGVNQLVERRQEPDLPRLEAWLAFYVRCYGSVEKLAAITMHRNELLAENPRELGRSISNTLKVLGLWQKVQAANQAVIPNQLAFKDAAEARLQIANLKDVAESRPDPVEGDEQGDGPEDGREKLVG